MNTKGDVTTLERLGDVGSKKGYDGDVRREDTEAGDVEKGGAGYEGCCGVEYDGIWARRRLGDGVGEIDWWWRSECVVN